MNDKDREEIVKAIDELISTETKPTPQSVIFRSGMNTGLRIAKRIVERHEERGEDGKDNYQRMPDMRI